MGLFEGIGISESTATIPELKILTTLSVAQIV
jgi:hypothetical protein